MHHCFRLLPAVFAALAIAQAAHAAERTVSNQEELRAALEAAEPGDEIVLNPGTYQGELSREGLRGVTIRSADPAAPAVIDGGSYGLHLMDPVDVTVQNLVFANQLDNGINIDDADSYETPATGIRLIGVTVRDMVNPGNHDAIKMAGVRDFLIDGVTVENWGNEGSAIDFVGCHSGLVQNALLKHDALEVGGSGIRPKGGAKDITIRANRVEISSGKGRAIQAGGSTDAEFFRFADGDSGYEAKDIVVEGNVVISGGSAFSWINIDGGLFHHNFVSRPTQWVGRILNENPGDAFIDTQNGQLTDNVIVFDDTDDEFNTAINIGEETRAETFSFARNRWYNLANPEASKPALPAEETDGVYGEQPTTSTDGAQVWQMPWGKWVVNTTASAQSVDLGDTQSLRRAVAAPGATFAPLLENPLNGSWSLEAIEGTTIEVPPRSQVILIDPAACAGCGG